MAGVTDRPFRMLCRRFGAGLAASEMLTADVRLWDTPKSRRRMDHRGEPSPRVVQIAGFDPTMMADAARRNVDAGAEIIDINMGCPAKKVCNRLAGSALLQDEALVARILASRGERRAGAGDAEDAHRLGPNAQEWRSYRANRRGLRHSGARDSRPHARGHVSGRCRTRHRARDQGQRSRFPCSRTATSIRRCARARFWPPPDATAS